MLSAAAWAQQPRAAQGPAAFIEIQAPVVALEHVRVIDGTSAAPVEDQTVVLMGGRIAALGPSGQVVVPAGARRVDLTGRTVIPEIGRAHV